MFNRPTNTYVQMKICSYFVLLKKNESFILHYDFE